MAITETKLSRRSVTTVPFFSDSGDATLESIRTAGTALKAAGKVVFSSTVSGDGLTQTNTTTFDSLDTWSQVDTWCTVALDMAYLNYVNTYGVPYTEPTDKSVQYHLSGITDPFYCTTTYSFATDPSKQAQADVFKADFKDFLLGGDTSAQFIVVDANTIKTIRNYTDSTDFTNNHLSDFRFTNQLYNFGCTRTITYTAGTYS